MIAPLSCASSSADHCEAPGDSRRTARQAVEGLGHSRIPTQWTPADGDIPKARSIADPANRDFLSGLGKLEVRAWGDYDYLCGPQYSRRPVRSNSSRSIDQ